METFTCRFADVNILIRANFPETKEFCKEYLIDEPAAFSVMISQEDIWEERKKSDKSSLKEFGRIINYSDAYLETIAVHRKIADEMLNYDTILFHGSAIVMDGETYLFTAKSGTGKSTHTRLWREVFGERVYMLNDDKPLLKMTDNGIIVYGTPWDGKHRLSRNTSAPLKAVCFLERDTINHIQPMSARDAFSIAWQQSYHPTEQTAAVKLLELLEKLLEQVKWHRLGCNMDTEAAKISYEGMK